MKRLVTLFLLTMTLSLTISTTGEAKNLFPPNVQLLGNANGIVYIEGDSPFLYANNMIPGDRINRKLILKNSYTDSYAIFLKSRRVSKNEKYDLLKKINLNISYEGKGIYKGNAIGDTGLKDNIYIDTINPGEEKSIDAVAELDGSAVNNEYKNKYGEVEWIFTAIRIPKDKIKSNNKRSIFNESLQGNSLIKSPKTGDSGILGYLLLIIIVGILFAIINKKEGKNNEGK